MALGLLGMTSGSLAISERVTSGPHAGHSVAVLPPEGADITLGRPGGGVTAPGGGSSVKPGWRRCTRSRSSSSRGLISMSALARALYSTAMSSRPSTSHSCICVDSPSLMDTRASGRWVRNARVSGTVSTRARLGGKPMATRPANAPRTRPRSSRARATWCRMPRPWLSSSLPASVGTAPRPLRTNRLWCRSTSSMRIWRDSAGCVMPNICAALVKLPNSATRTKLSICLKSMLPPVAVTGHHQLCQKRLPAIGIIRFTHG